ncbi:Protein CBG25624 [Caenorhabditis briggsae]|uniref:Protein CBG25624 n=1 Tax=Caenorhabditis briggsae TaxID=6238 RepID=B6IFA9_CAEBR|nr:Protein CBG25624 [Caenorhabditis briggsae]CAR98589.1 Protein CBG25624 [Caenorhabditis briggsae]
MFSFFDFSVYF